MMEAGLNPACLHYTYVDYILQTWEAFSKHI